MSWEAPMRLALAEAQAALAGAWIREHLPTVDGVFCSSALRTRQTYEATGLDAPVVFLDEVYDASPGEILEVVASADPVLRTVLVVGHAPGIPALAHELAGPDSDAAAVQQLEDRFPTSAIAVLRVPVPWAELEEDGAALTAVEIPR